MKPYKNKNQLSRMTKLQEWEAHLAHLTDLLEKGKPVAGMVATYEDKIKAYKKAQILVT